MKMQEFIDKERKNMSFKNSSGEISVSFTVGTYEYAIPNLKTLEKIDRHNNRKYHTSYRKELDLNLSKHNILIKGTDNLVEDVKKIYKDEFSQAVYNYNEKQLDERRKIGDYFEKVCNDKQKNIATEIILQIGDVNLDESSPHCHLIVVPVAKDLDRGMEKQVSLNKVLTRKNLAMLRGLLFKELLKKFNKVYECNKTLKRGSQLTEHLSMKDYKEYMIEKLL